MKLFEPKAGALDSLVPVHYFPTDDTFLTKEGDIGAVYKLRGVDFECLTDAALESVTLWLHNAVRSLHPDFRIYQYVLKRKGVNVAYHRATELYSFELYWGLVFEKKRGGVQFSRSLKVKERELLERISDMEVYLSSFVDTTTKTLGLERQNKEAIFPFLQKLLFSSGELRFSDHIDYWAAQTGIDIPGKRIEVGGPILSMSLRELPRTTSPNLLSDLLRLPCDLILCSEWKRCDPAKAIKLIEKSEEHFFFRKDNRNAKASRKRKKDGDGIEDKAALEDVSNLGDFGVRVKNRGEFVGEYSLRLILSGKNLERHAAEAKSIAGNFEAQLETDTYGSLDSYLSIIPGNKRRDIHKHWNLSMNFADLALVYAPPTGDRINKHLGKEALTILETTFGTPYYFNLHEDDLLGALIFGIMGSGKSFFTNLLLDRAQKYDQFSFVLDIGGSYKHLATSHGGTFIALAKRKQPFTMNPFDCERTEENMDFLVAFVHVLLGESGYTPTPQECQEIDEAVGKADRLSSLALSDNLTSRLYNWVGKGRFAHLFDNEKDTLSLGAFQAFDFQGVSEKVMEPLFFYIFNKISRIVYDPSNIGRPKGIYCDEVWKILKNDTAKTWLVEAGKTFRKHNGGIVLTTQSALDMKKVGLLDVVNEMCPTKVLLANPGANMRMYKRIFKLNSREVRIFAGLEKKKQLLVKTPNKSQVLNVIPTREQLWLYANSPNENIIREKAIAQLGHVEGIKALAEGRFDTA